MLNSEKNAFLDAVKSSSVEWGMFSFGTVKSEDYKLKARYHREGLIVQLQGSELWFVIFKAKFIETESCFACKGTSYSYTKEEFIERGWLTLSNQLVSDDGSHSVYVGNLTMATTALTKWINDTVPKFLEEKSVPDLWQMATMGESITSLAGADETSFTEPEREQLRKGVDQLREFVETTFEANEQQRKLTAQKLDILKAAIDHMGRMSWFTFALGTIITIGSTLYLNNEQGRVLLQFAREAFEGAAKYLH